MSVSILTKTLPSRVFTTILTCAVAVSWVTFSVFSAHQTNVGSIVGQDNSSKNEIGSVAVVMQNDQHFVRKLNLTANDLVYNSSDQTIYASVPSAAGNIGNSLTPINPRTGMLGSSVFVGSEPNILALADDGRTLYVTLEGAYSVRRFDLATQTPGLQFSLGREPGGGGSIYAASDIAVAPGNPNLLAVARYRFGVSPPGGGVAVFDNGVQRPLTTPGHTAGANFLAFSNTASLLYGGGYYEGLRTMTIDASGVTDNRLGTSFGVGRVKFVNGRIYASGGQVIDPVSRTLLGTFANASSSVFAVDAGANRAFYLVRESSGGSSTLALRVYDTNTFVQIASLTIPESQGDAKSIVRWGANGLALSTTENQVYLIQTSLIPSSEPIPTPTPTVSPTPTATATPFAVFVRQIELPSNDIVYHQQTQKIYAAVPSSGGSGIGNSVAIVNPATGTIENSVFVGSEPTKLALAGDNQTMYVNLDGASSIRRFNIATQTAGTQFYVGNDGDGPLAVSDLAVAPGNPNLVAVARQMRHTSPSPIGVAIFDNGVRRAQTGPGHIDGSFYLAYSNSDSTLFGSGSYNGLSIMNVGNTGVTVTGSVPFNGGTIKFDNGRVYSSTGQVIDPDTKSLIGSFTGFNGNSFNSAMVPDSANNRAYFLTSQSSGDLQLRAYDINTFRLIGTANITGVSGGAASVVRWGTNGLAFRAGNGRVVLVQTSLVNASEPVPTPTPSVSPTPTPSPAYIPTFVRRVNLPTNDLVFNNTTGTIQASVPSTAGVNLGNTITEVNPLTGATVSSTFVGSEPGLLAQGDDGRTLWLRLNGAGNAIRRYDMQTRTPGTQFVPDSSFHPQDMAVMPGSPQTLALATRYRGVVLFDNGVQRPTVSNGGTYAINRVEFSDSPSVLYGYESESSGFGLVKFNVTASGVTGTGLGGGLFYGYSNDIKFANGRLYSSSGRVIDPETRMAVGTFQNGGSTFTVDTALGRIFYLTNNVLTAYDINTFLKIGSVTLFNYNGATPTSLVRWGANGLAFRLPSTTSSPNDSQLYIIQSALVSSIGNIPTGLNLDASTYFPNENNQNFSITVKRTGDVSASTTVAFATANGTAIAGSDYTAVSGTLTFAPGETSKNINIPLLNDNVYEGSKTFTLTLSNPGGGALLTDPTMATVTIIDDESRPFLFNNGVNVMEPRVGTTLAAFTVRLTNASSQTVTVDYSTSNGTAIAGSDYVAAGGTLTFNPHETVKTVAIVINSDNANEADETFYLNLSNASNASISTTQVSATIRNFNLQTARRVPFDFDGDFKADISVFRPSTGSWYVNRSSNNSFMAQNFGLSGDLLTPADYDGDGLTDISVFRAGYWYRLNSSDNQFVAVPFGQAGDVPVPADFDGDKKADIAVFRPSNGYWYRLNSTNNQFVYQHFGMTGDKPVTGDFDGDGKTDLAVFRPSAASWYVLRSTNNSSYGVRFGVETDIPQAADFDGDGRTDIAVYRAGNWYRTNSSNGQFVAEQFGLPTDVPAAADYDGDGRTDVAVFRPSNGTWYFNGTATGFTGVQFGADEDKPVPSAYVP